MASKFVNTYSPSIPDIPSDIHLHTPPEQYDFNFVFPVQNIRSNRVELRPFVVSSFPSPSKGNSHTDIGPPLSPLCMHNRYGEVSKTTDQRSLAG